ncbi:PAS domain-containing sensor histidine kinase [Natronorubrum aibiense]|uniref:histidine kinase n=1 Tax=Natronorubrum aibiense TaxID=348826 RepID=A0A5P9P9E5_9EURY|nr:PAS domain S-box protein [Natronorubrum aibiense]QFU84753.1 PAS domain S-box protein [Natronorubrum aibiense]
MSTRASAPDDAFWEDVDDDVALHRYRTLVSTIDDGVYQLDSDGHFVAVNDMIVETTGYSREKLLGEHVSLVLTDDDVERIESEIVNQIETEDEDIATFEFGVQTADGETIPCELRINLLIEEGAFQGTIGVARNLSEKKQRLATLESAQASYDSITSVLDEADIGVFVLDDAFEIAWANETIGQYFGLDRDGLIGCDKQQVVHESITDTVDDSNRFAETVLATYDDNSYIEEFECHVTAGTDRAERWLEHRSKPIESGQYAGGRVELYYDITDRKQSEDALRATEQRFESLVDAVEEYAILRLDSDGHVISWNEGAKQIKGYNTDEILDEHISTFYTEADRAENVPEQNLERATEIGSVEDEGWRVRKDGSQFWANVTITTVWDEDGTHCGFLKVTRDMTDQYERERELESELQQVFGRISDAFYAVDEDFCFTHVNGRAEEILQHSREELLGENIWEAFPDARNTHGYEAFHRALETQKAVSYEETFPSLGGWFEVRVYPSETGLSVYFRDVTERKEREQAIRESERRYRTLAENFPNGLVTLFDEELQYTLAEGRAFDYLPHSRDDIEGHHLHEVWADDVVEVIEPVFQAALEGEKQSVEGTSEGREWILHVVPLADRDGEIHGGMTMALDITERKERERELLKYETIVETVNDGIYTVDEDGRFTMVNDAYCELTGYSRAELLGSHVSLVVDDETVERAKELEAEIAAENIDKPMAETMIQTADGDRVPSEATFSMLSGDGHERIGVARDITERKERERALEESERRYRTLVEHFPNGAVGLYNKNLTYTVAGGKMLNELGIPSDEIAGTSIYERYPDDLIEEIKPHFRAVFDGESKTFEVEYHNRHLIAHTLPVRNADDEIYAGMLMIQDITERKEYRRLLEESNKRLEQFAYAASHDLQEPLRMVTSYLQLIDNRYGDALDEDGEEFLEFAVDGAERMRDMIDGLLEYSRVETRGDPFEAVDLNDILEDVRKDMQVQIKESNAEIEIDELPCVEGDASQLRQVFQNLLSNAVEYSGSQPPRVDISAERDGTNWIVSVQDEGIGIDADEQELIFEVFQRLHTHEEHPGTGIGLALCRRIVERHGGEIWVESKPGDGATFSFTLPAASDCDT